MAILVEGINFQFSPSLGSAEVFCKLTFIAKSPQNHV